MITHEPFVESVASRARLDDAGRAGRLVKVTLAALAQRLDPPLRRRLHERVPGPERDATVASTPQDASGVAAFQEEVGRYVGTTPERARYLAQVVLSYLAEADPELGRELRAGLPAEVGALFDPPERYPARESAAVEAPAPLAAAELAAELRRRGQWSGDVHAISRTVGLPADRIPPLLNRVLQEAHDLSRHVEWRQGRDGITFTLRTSSVDAVTDADLELADRIDDAVTMVGSGGHPG